MKYILLSLTLFILMSCQKKETKNDLSKVNANEVIEVYNFEELELFLQSSRNQTTVVNFWATWCKPCIKELPYFENLGEKYKGEVKIVLVSLDFPNKLESQLIPFVSEKKLQSEVVLLDDPYENEWIPKVDTTWSGALPATLIFKGEKKQFFEKSFTQEELENEILKIKNL
ncbi:TlpA family protein disulfide reductase [Lutimonas sp.]|uniref:TlpA family protein disulfide reductase n=1 Tax=Lutimonas sp. TaxID=1872403 RepID=UPI003D9AB7A3